MYGVLTLAFALTRPNVLLVIADDLGKSDLPMYRQTQKDSGPQVPNLDRLAHDGVVFDRFYDSSTASIHAGGKASCSNSSSTAQRARGPCPTPDW